MNDEPTNLDRLHDLALPAEVPWWPPAPGWYAVLLIPLLIAMWIFWRSWLKWNANAFRREALEQLAKARDTVTVAEILRRAALAVTPRSKISELTGEAWPNWLSSRCARPLPENVRELLRVGVYEQESLLDGDADNLLASMKCYASSWIKEFKPASDEAVV